MKLTLDHRFLLDLFSGLLSERNKGLKREKPARILSLAGYRGIVMMLGCFLEVRVVWLGGDCLKQCLCR